MLVFVSIALGSFLWLVGSFIFGHDHDVDHDVDHDTDHDGDHGETGGGEPTIGFFSSKVIATLLMGFGAAGAIARRYDADYLIASLWGVACGLALSLLMYGILRMIYGQQVSAAVETKKTIGQIGIVSVSIEGDGIGQIMIVVSGQNMSYPARSENGQFLPRGTSVIVKDVIGSELLVAKR